LGRERKVEGVKPLSVIFHSILCGKLSLRCHNDWIFSKAKDSANQKGNEDWERMFALRAYSNRLSSYH